MNTEETKYQKAKERVEVIKNFYIHLIVYGVVNLMLFSINMIVTPDGLWFIWPLLGWGLGVVFHALSIFGSGRGFGTDWEERKIKELMENE